MQPSPPQPLVKIVFFDGICNLCNGFVRFLLFALRHKAPFKFASLQGTTAQKLLPEALHKNLSSIVYFENGQVWTQSSAVLKIFLEMGGPWKSMAIFYLIPIFLRDKLYLCIAHHRYRIFGQRTSCRLPLPEEKNYFLD